MNDERKVIVGVCLKYPRKTCGGLCGKSGYRDGESSRTSRVEIYSGSVEGPVTTGTLGNYRYVARSNGKDDR